MKAKKINSIKKQIKWNLVIESEEELSLYEQVLEDVLNYLYSNSKATFQEIVKYVNGNDRDT